MDIRKRLLEPVGIGAVACLLAFGVDATSAKAENLANNATMTIDYATQTLILMWNIPWDFKKDIQEPVPNSCLDFRTWPAGNI